MPSFLSTDIFTRWSWLGFCVGKSVGWDESARDVKVQRIAFPFDVVVNVGAQCKIKSLPFGIKSSLFCSGDKSFALFVVIEFVTSSECRICLSSLKYLFVAEHLKIQTKPKKSHLNVTSRRMILFSIKYRKRWKSSFLTLTINRLPLLSLKYLQINFPDYLRNQFEWRKDQAELKVTMLLIKYTFPRCQSWYSIRCWNSKGNLHAVHFQWGN